MKRRLTNFIRTIFRSKTGNVLCIVHLVLLCYVTFEKPVAYSADDPQLAGVNYIAGRYFHFTYESLLYKTLLLLDLPAYFLATALALPFGLLGLKLSAWNDSWLAFLFILLTTSLFWQAFGYAFEWFWKGFLHERKLNKMNQHILLFLLLSFTRMLVPTYGQSVNMAHPLDPLTKDEIALAANTLKAYDKFPQGGRFPTIVLHEPPKAEVLAFKPGQTLRREAFALIYNRTANVSYEAVVDLNAKRVLSWKEHPNAQPGFMYEDIFIVQSAVRTNPEWQAAMRKRGITEFGKVQIEPWPAGYYGFPEEEGKRLIRALSYYRGDSKMPYAHPVENVIAVVDLNQKRVLKLIDDGVVPVPKADADIDEKSVGQLREAPKPLQIVQPQGASFTVQGNEIRWQKWRFRYALHPREGLVLYTVGYEDVGKLRSILYRASLSEMVVPYGDPSTGWFFRNAFDEGEAMVGSLALPLVDKIDVPENATVLDAVLSGENGTAMEKKHVIGLYERDGGVLWKHVDYLTNTNESRRARQLVLSWFANVGNYEYGFNWVFHQDGTLEMEAMLTGVMSTKGVKAKGEHVHSDFWHLVADGVAAPHHQHFFNYRLDFDVDGTANTVLEQNSEALPAGKDNPHANAFAMRETPLRNEAEAQRQLNLASQRRWRVINPSVKNALGHNVGYQLVTGENSLPFAGPNSMVRKRAGFMNSHLWVTQHAAAEQYAAGLFVNQSNGQSKGGDGLPSWVKQNRPLENEDVVVWYTFGVTHLPRPEDYPVMPVHKTGFKLMPVAFFARNPALDVPK